MIELQIARIVVGIVAKLCLPLIHLKGSLIILLNLDNKGDIAKGQYRLTESPLGLPESKFRDNS